MTTFYLSVSWAVSGAGTYYASAERPSTSGRYGGRGTPSFNGKRHNLTPSPRASSQCLLSKTLMDQTTALCLAVQLQPFLH